MNFTNYDRFKDLLDSKIVKMLFPEYPENDWEYRRQAVKIYVFPQTWGSTACGNRGIGMLNDNHVNDCIFNKLS